ncbi:hypothetical protein [Rhodococcus koreensis]
MDALLDAVWKQIPGFIASVILLVLAWFIGNRLTYKWNLRQKRRELDLAAARSFHALYGEFFTVWKLWNYFVRDVGAEPLKGASRWDILKRACEAEGKLESTLVLLSCEHRLEPEDIETLGHFRQLYQQLREAIRDNYALEWDGSEHPDYVSFKTLAPKVASLVVSERPASSPDGAADALRRITSNEWEPAVYWHFHNPK